MTDHSSPVLSDARQEMRQIVWRMQSGEATLEEMLRYVNGELREALDSLEPDAPKNGWIVDGWHASACVLRAWATLTGSAFQKRLEKQMDFVKEIKALRNDLSDAHRELDHLKKQVKHKAVPWQTREHIEWNPDDTVSVARMQEALGQHYFNHGGLLRTTVRGEIVELKAGDVLTFEAPRWTPIEVNSDLKARWDMNDPRTNPGIRTCVEQAEAALSPVEDVRCLCGHGEADHGKTGTCLVRGRGEGWTYDPCGCGEFRAEKDAR